MSLVTVLEAVQNLAGDDVEFVSDSVDAKGHYPSTMTYDGYVIAEFSGKDGDPWQCRGNELALIETFEGYQDLEGDEKEIVKEALVDRIRVLSQEYWGKVSNNTLGADTAAPEERRGGDPAAWAIGEICEGLSEKEEFGDKLLRIRGKLRGDKTMRTYGLSFYKFKTTAKEGMPSREIALINVFRKLRDPRPHAPERWEKVNLLHNGQNKGSICYRGDNGQWSFIKETVQYWLDRAGSYVDENGNTVDRTWEQVCEAYPDHLMTKIAVYGTEYASSAS